jgi:hypothetical protein
MSKSIKICKAGLTGKTDTPPPSNPQIYSLASLATMRMEITNSNHTTIKMVALKNTKSKRPV